MRVTSQLFEEMPCISQKKIFRIVLGCSALTVAAAAVALARGCHPVPVEKPIPMPAVLDAKKVSFEQINTEKTR